MRKKIRSTLRLVRGKVRNLDFLIRIEASSSVRDGGKWPKKKCESFGSFSIASTPNTNTLGDYFSQYGGGYRA